MQDGYTVVLEHMQEGCLSGIIETEEQQLCVLVGEAERGQKVEDCMRISASCAIDMLRRRPCMGYVELGNTYTCV